MTVARATRLPGVYFLAEATAPRDELPRMDVGAFVGFAARGPVHVPVAVEDAAQFRDVFGDDLSLAWDDGSGRMQRSLLGPTVELFFRNGGRRCWVVRVADTDPASGAQSQEFLIPGLYRTDAPFAPARALARCPGAWADGLRLGARLNVRPLAAASVRLPGSPSSYVARLEQVPVALVPGDLLELRWREARLRLYLFVDDVATSGDAQRVTAVTGLWFEETSASSPPASPSPGVEAGGLIALDEATAWAAWSATGSPPATLQARLLRLELLAWEGEALNARIGELGFDPRHPRFWAALPDDDTLFRRLVEHRRGGLGTELPALWRDALAPRFPYAGDGNNVRYLPLGVPRQSDSRAAAGAQLDLRALGLAAEGLAALSADLFLDPDLAANNGATLLAEAKHKRFVRGRPLDGIHSLLPIEEVSLIAVPDAAQRHWDRRPRAADPPLTAPVLEAISARDARGRRTLEWSAVDDVKEYLVELAGGPEFPDARRFRVERAARLELLETASTEAPPHHLVVTLDEDCPVEYYFRVRAVGYAATSAWSNTLVLRLPEGGFRDCVRADVEALGLVLDLEPASGSARRLVWTAASPAGLDASADMFELQEARDADFTAADTCYRGPLPEVEVTAQPDVRTFFRVRAWTPTGPGPWSNTVAAEPLVLSADSVVTPADFDAQDLLAVHFALSRVCAARADCVALLSVPGHYRAGALHAHLDLLAPQAGASPGRFGSGVVRVPALRQDETPVLSYVALFHPWLFPARPGADRSLRAAPVPPDGAATGLIAAGSRTRGAWISPANQALADVLGLSTAFDSADAAALTERQVNLLRHGPRGFRLAQADTLSPGDELRALSVRRFMTLLRRLIEREGVRYVFEPNGEDLRDAVRAQWQQLLLDLYARGALRGARPEEAFRVVIDPGREGERAGELGRLVVELQVAPSQPLRFLNVRLIQAGSDGLVVQEV